MQVFQNYMRSKKKHTHSQIVSSWSPYRKLTLFFNTASVQPMRERFHAHRLVSQRHIEVYVRLLGPAGNLSKKKQRELLVHIQKKRSKFFFYRFWCALYLSVYNIINLMKLVKSAIKNVPSGGRGISMYTSHKKKHWNASHSYRNLYRREKCGLTTVVMPSYAPY